MKTKDLEKELGIKKQTLIYYEKEGLINPKRDNNNYRNYSNEDVDIIKLIMFLRSLDICIDEIKLILNETISIKDVLENKRKNIEKTLQELDRIEKNIQRYIRRKNVAAIVNHSKINKEFNDYEKLYFNEDGIDYKDIHIDLTKIKSIRISMFSYNSTVRKGSKKLTLALLVSTMFSTQTASGVGVAGMHQFGIDLDIDLGREFYSFSIENNSAYQDMMRYIRNHNIPRDDILNLVDLYADSSDRVATYNYINRNFAAWAKEYDLDNPRDYY